MRGIKRGTLLLGCLLLLAGGALGQGYADTFVFQEGATGLYGFIDRSGQIVEPAIWEEPPYFEEDNIWNPVADWSVARKEGRYGVIARDGEIVLPFEWESIWFVSPELFAVKKDGKSGVIQRDGTEALPFIWDDLGGGPIAVQAGLLTIRKGGLTGWIDLSGRVLCPPTWDTAAPYQDDQGKVYIKVRRDRLYGITDIDGNVIVEPLYNYVGLYREGLIPVQKGQRWGFLDEAGQEALPFVYQEAESFLDAAARVKRDGKVFYIDHTGAKVEAPERATADPGPWEGWNVVEKGGKYGLEDVEGNLVLPCAWATLYPIAPGGYFLFKRDGAQRAGVLRADGEIIIDSHWHRISSAGGDPPLFLVEKNEEYHYYDHMGALVFSWPK